MSNFKSPLHEMSTTTVTEYWNDSSSISELEYGIEHGAVGATTNPVIVVDVLKKDSNVWNERIKEIFREMPTASEDDIAWKLIDEMAIKAGALLLPKFEQSKGKKGRLSMQTNAKYYRNAELMIQQALHFQELLPNLNVKMPVTKAGIAAIEEVTYQGISINATVSFTVPQAIAVAEAVERGLARRESEGLDCTTMAPVCTIMVGRVDDWLKIVAEKHNIITHPDYLEWAGVAVFKNAYKYYQNKKYRTRLLAAAYRNHYHWSEFIGGNVVVTIPYKWAKRFNNSSVTVLHRIDTPVETKIIEELSSKFDEFRKAYEPDGLSIDEFDSYGATARTLRQFIGSYDELCRMIRDLVLPNPDK